MVVSLAQDPVSLLTYALMAMSIFSLWVIPRAELWLSLLGISTLTGFYSGRLEVRGVLTVIVFTWMCFLFYSPGLNRKAKRVLGIFVFMGALLLGAHQVPGFSELAGDLRSFFDAGCQTYAALS